MEGRWTIYPAWPSGAGSATVEGPERAEKVPVVPCDDAAIARGARIVRELLAAPPEAIELVDPDHFAAYVARHVLSAAGETP